MSKYYFRIEAKSNKAEIELPSSSTSDERRMYLYNDGHVERINPPQNASDDLESYDTMGISITRLGIMPATPRAFMTRDLRDPQTDLEWRVLGFDYVDVPEDQPERYQLGHAYGNNHVHGNNSAPGDMATNSWFWLLYDTDHLKLTGGGDGNARCLLSGRLAMFWGLVALSFGWRDLDTLDLRAQGDQFNIVWPHDRGPHRSRDQFITIEIYRHQDRTIRLETIEENWRLA